MIGYFFYVLYVMVILWGISPFISCNTKQYHRILLPFTFLPHFNVTCFLKIGLTVSFLELYAFFVLLCIIGCRIKIKLRFGTTDWLFLILTLFSLLSLVISIFRVQLIGDLNPDTNLGNNPFIRGFMSLNKMIFYPVVFLVIRNFFIDQSVEINAHFKKYTAIAGILPMIAVFIQTLGIPFLLYFNNPSFATNLGWWNSPRPLGLTNEASFYSFQVVFAIIAAYYCYKERLYSKRFCIFLIVLYLFSILCSLSRTGMVVVTIFFLLKFRKQFSFAKVCLLGGFFVLLFNLNIAGFNMGNRFMSSFDVEADQSTIERYGSQEALVALALDKSCVFGVGAFNYYFYITNYLPAYYTNVIKYARDEPIPSFNFIVQLIAEFGLLVFLLYLFFSYKTLKKIDSRFVKDWIFILAFFALSFQVLNFSLPYTILLYSPNNDR